MSRTGIVHDHENVIEVESRRFRPAVGWLLVLAACVFLATFCSRSSNPRSRLVVARILEPEGAVEESIRVNAARSARYRWSAADVLSDWVRAAGEDSVTFGSPALELDGLDEVDSVIVTFAEPAAAGRVLLLWSGEPVLSRGDFLRNRRELRPDSSSSVVIRGKDLRAHSRTSLLHLFLHLEDTTDPRAVIDSIAVVTLDERMAAPTPQRARVMVAGEMRDALYLRPPASWSRPLDIPEDAELLFGLHSGSRAHVRLSVLAGGSRTRIFDGSATGTGGGWQDVRVPLPQAANAVLELEAAIEGDASAEPLLWSTPLVVAPRGTPRPNVVLYVVDSLRADVLGLYGAEPGTSPFLDELAGRSLVFERCYAATTWTKPSVASLLTALYPRTHGLGKRHYTDSLPDHVLTLADYFRSEGYLTAQFTANPFSGTLSNLDRGFDHYLAPDAFASEDATRVSASAMNARILPWLEAHAGERFFVYIQSVDPHPPFPTDGDAPIDAYRAAVRSNDEQIARLYRHLSDLGLADDTLFVLTSDHGEAFGEHGFSGHGQSVYEEEARVPLILHWPNRIRAARTDVVAQHVDVLPTVLDYASISFDGATIEGRSLFGPAGEGRRPAYVSRFVYPDDIDLEDIDRTEAHAVIDLPWKLIVTEGGPTELYHLSDDPSERSDRAADHPERVRALRAGLERFLSERARARARLIGPGGGASQNDEARVPSPDALEQLRVLGYVK